jgi:alkanesulfonate monooxygenase SsuD/methylene tetrahydromethanopterin reductase-like flavin-dependent oxidoreductase (luciferase family)
MGMLKNIGTLARGRGAERYTNLKDYSGPPIEFDDAPLLGTPDEIIARLKKLEAGGVEHILLVDPSGSIETLRIFAAEVMPAFAKSPVRVS